MMHEMLHWVRERERVRLKKEACDPFPWTSDPIIKEWRFCCVRREDDRVTKWIHENIRVPFGDHPDLWFMLCIARQINWPSTLAELISYPRAWPVDHTTFDPLVMGEVLQAMANADEKVFTGAYIITAPTEKGAKKARFLAEETLGALWRDRDKLRETFSLSGLRIAGAHAALKEYNGWGNFLSYQACVDMRFTRILGEAPDVNTWAAAGPGTLRGLNRVHGRHIKHSLTQAQALDEMRAIYALVRAETDVDIDFSDVPNILCETDKYLRVKLGEGEPRARYVPGRGW